jgi:CRP/FNR family cyclic AMP-dependent transcriptional regulator
MSESPKAASRNLQILKDHPIFADTPVAALERLAHVARIRQIHKNSVVFYQSDPSDLVYLVYTGSIAILLNSSDGRELLINEVRPGGWFGEVGVISGLPRSATAMAHEKSELMAIPGQAFMEILKTDLHFAGRFLNFLSLQVINSSLRESALAFLDAPGRMARVLLEMDHLNSDKGYLTLSQDELAQRTGLTRQTVAKILGRWRRAGWLLTGRGHIMLLNREMLQRAG